MTDTKQRVATLLFLCCVVVATTFFLSTRRPRNWPTRAFRDDLRAKSLYAYVQYATNVEYGCNTLVNFAALRALGTHADLVLLAPTEWSGSNKTEVAKVLEVADSLNVTVRYVEPWEANTESSDRTWQWSLTKLHAFELYDYLRVISFDSDGVLKKPLDDLFHLPEVDLAMTRAYWLSDTNADGSIRPWLTSLLVVSNPSPRLASRMRSLAAAHNQSGTFDMELLNDAAAGQALILPHRPLTMLSGELRHTVDHSKYIGADVTWNATAEFEAAHYIHFSDWPLRKPWLLEDDEIAREALKRCNGVDGCEEGELWRTLYDNYRAARRKTCRLP